jgi:competence protein ComEC
MLLLAALILMITAGCPAPLHNSSPSVLRVTFLDVGQGDSTVIESPTGQVIVVDGGGIPGLDPRLGDDPGSRVVVPFLRSRGISTVDLIVPTHPDDDHVQGLIAVVNQLTVRAVLDGNLSTDNGAYALLQERIKARRVRVDTARRGQRVDIGGGAFLEVLHPTGKRLGGRSATNNDSVVLRLVYGKARLLLTGDTEEEAEADLLASRQNLTADVLKVGHHGSRWSSTEPFLESVRPSVAIISAGRSNAFGHPNREVLTRLEQRGTRVFRTDRHGAVTARTDGTRIQIIPTVAEKAVN